MLGNVSSFLLCMDCVDEFLCQCNIHCSMAVFREIEAFGLSVVVILGYLIMCILALLMKICCFGNWLLMGT